MLSFSKELNGTENGMRATSAEISFWKIHAHFEFTAIKVCLPTRTTVLICAECFKTCIYHPALLITHAKCTNNPPYHHRYWHLNPALTTNRMLPLLLSLRTQPMGFPKIISIQFQLYFVRPKGKVNRSWVSSNPEKGVTPLCLLCICILNVSFFTTVTSCVHWQWSPGVSEHMQWFLLQNRSHFYHLKITAIHYSFLALSPAQGFLWNFWIFQLHAVREEIHKFLAILH